VWGADVSGNGGVCAVGNVWVYGCLREMVLAKTCGGRRERRLELGAI
jgi:septum formation inhibitor MinC